MTAQRNNTPSSSDSETRASNTTRAQIRAIIDFFVDNPRYWNTYLGRHNGAAPIAGSQLTRRKSV